MTDDLPTQLREASTEDRAEVEVLLRKAAARVEADTEYITKIEAVALQATSAGEVLLEAVRARDAAIAEALAAWHRGMEHNDAGEFIVNDEAIDQAMTDLWDALSRVPQGAAEPKTPEGGARASRASDTGTSNTNRASLGPTAEPWTDPEPWERFNGGRAPSDLSHLNPGFWTYSPRSREQYDAEEGNHG